MGGDNDQSQLISEMKVFYLSTGPLGTMFQSANLFNIILFCAKTERGTEGFAYH